MDWVWLSSIQRVGKKRGFAISKFLSGFFSKRKILLLIQYCYVLWSMVKVVPRGVSLDDI
jgi:hypothetical protein